MAGKVRSDDYVRIRDRVIHLGGLKDPDNELINMANRGWYDEGTASQLVPLVLLQQFQQDPAR